MPTEASRLSWTGKTIEGYVDHYMERVFGKPDQQSLSEVIGNYIGIDIDLKLVSTSSHHRLVGKKMSISCAACRFIHRCFHHRSPARLLYHLRIH